MTSFLFLSKWVSFLSITCTIIVGLTILTWVIARAEPPFTGCPTDVALVSLFLIYIARLAVIETPSLANLADEDSRYACALTMAFTVQFPLPQVRHLYFVS